MKENLIGPSERSLLVRQNVLEITLFLVVCLIAHIIFEMNQIKKADFPVHRQKDFTVKRQAISKHLIYYNRFTAEMLND